MSADSFDKKFTADVDIFDIRWSDVQILDILQHRAARREALRGIAACIQPRTIGIELGAKF